MRHATDDIDISKIRRRDLSAQCRSRFRHALIVFALFVVGATSLANAATYTVTNTLDTAGSTCVGSCSLRQAIGAANLNTGNHTIAFNIPIGAGAAVITLGSALPTIARNNLVIDGTTQTVSQLDPNPAILGAGGVVGVDSVALSTVAGPDVEIRAGAAIANGFNITANNVTIQGLAILGFGSSDDHGAIRLASTASGATIQNNVLGSTAALFTDPGTALRNWSGVTSIGADNGTITNNLIGFSEERGIWMDPGSTNWTISNNEIRDIGMGSVDGDGTSILAGCDSLSYTGNLFIGSSSQAAAIRGSTNLTFTNNTFKENGVGDAILGVNQSAGVTVRPGAISALFDRNIFENNYGAGLQVNETATGPGTRLTRNSFVRNGTDFARDLSLPTGQIGIDLNGSGEDDDLGTTDFFTKNDNNDTDVGGNTLINFPILDTATIVGGNLVLTGWSLPGATIELFISDGDAFGFGEGETYLDTVVEGVADGDSGSSLYGSGLINGLDQGTDTTNRFSFTITPVPAGVVEGTQLTATGTIGNNTSEFSGVVTAVANSTISGRVFEDANFAGTATDYDGGASDQALANVDVELYTNADVYVTSTVTDGSGNYSFPGLVNGTYKVRARSATIGDSNTLPGGTFNAVCGITDPTSGVACAVAEQTWGNGAVAYGGQSATADDTATNNDAGPGDTWVSVAVNTADVTNVNFGFAYNLIVNTNDAGQGSLRQFVDNANAIGAANGTTANTSEFRIGVPGVHTITLASALPQITDNQTVIDGQTQTDNVGSTNAADFTHPFYGGGKSVGTGIDGIVGTGDEFTLPAYPNPEIEINGNDVTSIFELTADAGVVKRLALFNSASGEAVLISGGAGNVVEENYVGLRADGSDPGGALRLQHGLEVTGGSAFIRNNIVAYSELGGSLIASTATVSGNEYLSNSLLSANGDAISAESSSGETITVRDNRIHDSSAYAFESWNAPGPFTVENNTISDSGNGGGNEIGGIRIFGANSTVRYNVVTDAVGAGIMVAQTGASNSQNLISRNSTYANGGLGIDIEATDFVSPDGDGVTPNNGAINTGIPNNEMDYPVITVSSLSGTTLHVEGYVGTAATKIAAVHTLEFYKAADDLNNNGEIEAGDALSVPHGEGQTYIDTCSTAATGLFICDLTVPAGVSLSPGDDVTGIAYDTNNNTSEFGANSVVTGPTFSISGTVFEDIIGDALNDGAINSANNPGAGDVTVRLYRDTGDGIPNAADTFVTSTTTDATPGPTEGTYSFPSLAAGTYFIAVDSQTMDAPDAGLHNGSYNSGVWAEQTYGGVSSYCADGTGGTTITGAAGECFGGRRGDISDANTDAGTAEHVIRITLGGSATDVDFGLSFNVFVNTSVATANSSNTTRSDQGSLDQALRNAADIIGPNALRFVPAMPTNASGGGGNWWSIDYVNLGTEDEPHRIEDIDTIVDGTALDLTDGITALDNTNPGFLGTNAAGGVGVGVSDFALPQVEKPELEIIGQLELRSFAATRSPENAIIRDLAIWGTVANALLDISHSAATPAPNILIENIVVGSRPDAFVDAGGNSSRAIWTRGPVEDGTIRNSLVGFQGSAPSIVQVDPGWVIENNEFAGAFAGVYTTEGNLTIRRNLFDGVSGNFVAGPTPGPWEENTVRNATGGGLTLRSDGHTVQRNIFENNTGYGVGVSHDTGPPTPAHDNRITDNIFTNNGSVAIDLFDSATGEDQVTPNDGTTAAGSGNQAIDYPIIDGAALIGGNLTVTGFARAGATIEFYEAVGAANDNNAAGNSHGEGVALLFTAIEGIADGDTTTGASYTDPGYGADSNVNRFSFTVAAPAGLVVGEEVSPMAYLAGSGTSEFGPNFSVTGPTTIAGTIFVDSVGDGLADGPIGVGPNLWEAGARIELYRAGPDGDADGGDDTYVGFTTSSAVDGSYSFTGLLPDTYYVTVDSQGVDDGPYNPGYSGLDAWAEQTYGPVGAASFDGATWTYAAAAGAFYGGARWDVSDNHVPTNSLPTGEHIARVDTTGGDISNVDFGFSFNVVTSTRGSTAAQDPGAGGGQRTVQGSFRQFLTNANAHNSNDTMRFVPAAPTNATLGVDNWWSIAVTATLPAIEDNQTTIDGTAYQLDGVTLDNSNNATLGAGGTVGVGADGIAATADEPALPQLNGPEFELDGSTMLRGLEVQGGNVTIRRIAIYGFGTGANVPNSGNILVNDVAATGTLIEQNVIGSAAGAFADPGVGVRSQSDNIRVQAGTGTIRQNLIGFSRAGGAKAGVGGWLIEGNEIRGNAIDQSHLDGVNTAGSGSIVQENLIIDNEGAGIDGFGSVGSQVFRNNTVIGNGIGIVNGPAIADETPGIRVYGDAAVVDLNLITANFGAGILVSDGATNATISRNSTFDNGIILNKGLLGPSGQIGIDLVEFGRDNASGLPAPFVTPNPQTVGGNGLFDYPVFTSALIVGANLELRGTSIAGAVIEFFISDGDGSGFGEGETYLFSDAEGSGTDFDATAGSFFFQVPTPAGVSLGTEITSTATSGTGATSEFSAIAIASSAGGISGTIFEDTAGNVLDGGEAIGDANNPTVNGVDIRLYNDDGATANQPDGTDTLRAGPVATAGVGAYSFAGIPDGTYWVVVDSRTVSPVAGIHPSYLATTPWAEQTYGPDNGWCADGVGGTAERVGSGPCYGGVDGATDDDVAALTSSEHIARVVISGGAVSNVDFGFSYNAVTNVEPAGNVSLTASTYQGSIDQFVRNANSINGANAMRFVPAIPTNAVGGGGAWWRVDYTTSILGETISNVHDAGTSINGTAYDLTDGVTVRNTNPGNLGANAAGGLTVGVALVPLPQVAKPELELMRSDSGIGDGVHFDSNLATGQVPNQFAVRDMSIWGFSTGIAMTGVPAAPVTGITLERNVIGSRPDAFVDPGGPNALVGVRTASTTNTSIVNNLIGFLDNDGVQASAVTTTAVSGNEIRETGQVNTAADGLNYGSGSASGSLTGNLIVDSGGMGIDGTSIGNLVADNTVTGSGQRGVQTGGIRQTGSNNLVRGNIVSGNAGPGLIVPDSVNDITAMQNHFSGNGSIAIDLVAAGGDTATGDGIMLNDGATDVNDGNDGLDYPIIDGAALSGGNLTVTGFARAGVTIEFYEAVGAVNDNNVSGNPHGEGITYLFTSIEGIADADPTIGASYTDPGYGTDASVDRFSFTVAAPAGLVVGDELSAIANVAGNGTSEFGPNFTVTGPVVAISGSVFEDIAGNVLDGGESIGDAGNPTINGVDVWLYNDDGATANQPDGTDTLRAGPIATAGAGAFSFSGVPDGTYWVVVDSQDLGTAPAWAEQTYGPIGGWCADGAGGTAENVSAGACYGGRRAGASDDLTTWNSGAEHIARVVVSGGAASNVTFGFSFNVVTTTRGGSAAADPGATGAQTVQGSLRQFIQNANTIAGANAMRFVPAGPTNATLAGNNWWRVSITDQLPDLVDAGTIVDGAAYSRVDGVTLSNTNTAAIGTGAAVGVLGVFITPQLDPELEIQGDGVVTAAFNALATADNTEIRNTTMNRFATVAVSAIGALPDPIDSFVVENNVIGTSPASFTDDPSLFTGAGIVGRDYSNSTIRNNLVGWVGRGFQISFNSVDMLIETNEIRGSDTWSIYLNGVASTSQQAERITLQGNFIESSTYIGTTLETQDALSDVTINQNTIRFNNGRGVRLYGSNNTVTGNIISNNNGDALTLVGDVSPSVPAAASNLISQNQFGDNTGQAIDLTETGANGDNTTINDDGDPDLGANELLNFPIIESAQIVGPNLVISGYALPGTTIELYIADADPSGFGEGVTYLLTLIEGSGADTDGTSGTYGPGPINGLLQGTDTTNRYTFSVPTPAGVSLGTDLTATGTIANATSEFSGRITVSNNTDLVTTKVLDPSTPGPFAEGDTVTYLLTVTNNGPGQATSVTSTDTYPSELTLGTPVPSAPTTYVAATGVWTIGTLNSGASVTLQLPGTVNAGTAGDVVTNSTTVAVGDQVDPTTAGDDLTEVFTVLPFLNIDDVAQVETNSVPGTTTFTFTVSINQAIGSNVTFDFDTADGTATVADSDYVAISGGSGTILAGATTTTIDVTVNGDDGIEANETFFVNLSNVLGAAVTDGQGQGTINNDDGAMVSVAATTDANEAGSIDGQFTVTQTTTSASDTVVTYTVAGTATPGGTDYTTLSGTVTVAAGATTATIDVTGIVADALVEGIETVIVTLTATDNPGITVAPSPSNTATINILDNNGSNVSVAPTTDANEAGPIDGQFTVTQSAVSASDTIVSYTVAGTATAGDTDYTTLSGSVTVVAGATTATIDVTGIVDDAFVEGSETVIVTLTGTDNVAIAVAASPNDTASINILDNDGASVSIASTTNGAESGPVNGVFTVTQSATSINDTVLSYTVAGTATSASDYTALSGTVTILGGATTATITVPVIDDVVAEGVDETVIVTLTSITASDAGISIAASPADTASLTIADDDTDLITTKAVSNATPLEGDSITYTITVNNSAGVQATNVSLTDLLPAGVSYVSDDSGGTYNSTSGLWSIGAVNAATVATLNITATVDVGASALAQPISNTTTAATGDQADPDATTDVLTANITVDANADLVTTKIVDNATPVENATIVYTLSVFNNGAAQATNVSLIDLLPTGISYFSDDSGGAYNPVTGVWTIGTIDNGAIATLNITATVDTGAGALAQPITNITTAAIGDQPDPDTTTDDLTEDITVNYTADIVTTKTVDVTSPLSGDTVIYTLTATNNGPGPATNVTLTDLLPAGVTYFSDDGAGTYNSATGVWTIGNLANGAVAILNISATVDAGAGLLPQPITNTTTAAIGDQADADPTGDDLVADIIVNLIDPNLIQLNKTVGRDRANVGEIVSYSIEIRNTQSNPIAVVRISDSPARGFKYVPGTAQFDGVPISDPTVVLPLEFNIGTLPGFVDGNGNGVADPGEPGYAVLSYRMVAGSGTAPGIWTNTAIATATCDTCFVSNIASADIEIIEDTLFDLGTIIGKVFYDGDNDGSQDSGEAGIEAAMVALDDGTYALTDEFGRYHFPAVKPGQRLLKINLNSLAGQAKSTNGNTRIVSVTPGLMAKANFGVILDTVDAAIGEEGQFGIAVDSETMHPPLLINGSTVMPSLLVNGEPVSLASADVKLGTRKLRDVVELSGGKLSNPIRFNTKVDADATIKRWKLIVTGSRDEIAKTWKGKGTPPEFIEWDGVRKTGKLINSGGIYNYHLELTTSDGQKVSSSHRLFGVNRLNSISLNLAGGAFVSASHELTSKAKALLAETAKAIREYPDEIVVISGHTDSVGSDESNMALAERRARSAYDYLRKNEGLPEEQFVIQAFGETRPIAGNDTAWGRELNRRVEISGDLDSIDRARNFDPYRQAPVVRINASDIDIDKSGAFRTRIDLESGQETMRVLLSTSQGRSVETVVRLPTIHVISPQGRVAVPIDRDKPDPASFDVDDVVLRTELLASTEPGNVVEFNGEPVDVDDNGLFIVPLAIRTGDNYYGLVARNPMGMLRIANVKLTLDDSSINEPEFVVEPIPQLALQLPPPGIPMTNSNLVIPGSTVPGNRVYINDNEIEVKSDGSFTATVELELGENLFTARVVDQDGHAGSIEQVFDYNGDPMFFMALVDGTFSQLKTTGSLEAAGNVARDETISRGRIAYYLKGHVLGKYLLTSAFDSGEQELGEIFSDLTAQDNDRLLTNLDPDTLYPVYGDNSTLVYDAQSQSKFYLALESETITALVGNYALNFTDTELAGYQRTLYGASATYQSEAKDESGNSKTKAQAFYANIEQAHVRDELRATGGSLYYLSQRGVIEGSEHISVIVRDRDSGLILRRTALQQGLDYNIDYVDGRLLTNRPISSFSADNSLVESDLLGGSAVYLQIDYETILGGFQQTATGGRVRQAVGEHLAVGVTSVDEEQVGGEYSLKAADAEFKFGNNSRLLAEFASSEGNNSAVNISEDGGLTYQTVTPIAGSSGDAFKIAAEIDAGEWFGYEDRLLMSTYFKRLDTGFSANSVTTEQGSEKSGFAASWEISDGNSLLGRFEQQTQLASGDENTLATLQWNFVRKLWGVAAEIEDRGGYSGDATIAAVRMSNRWTDTLSTTLTHQQTIAGLENDQSTLGVAYRATDRLTLDASATHGTKGASARLGAQLDIGGNKFYVAQQLNNLETSGNSNNSLVGVEAPFGQDGAIYSEYHWSRLPVGRQRQAMFGARQRFQATEGLRIEVSGEHSSENAAVSNTGERYALSIGATFDNDGGISFSTRNEYRKDSRTVDSEQFLSTNNLQLALGDDLSVLGKYRFSKSDSSVQLNRDIDFTEASIGLAYRPVEHDRLNLLTRFTRLTNTPTEFQQAGSTAGMTSDIFAVDWSYQLSRRIEWVGKQAMRWSEGDEDPLALRSRTSLTIQRLNWSMPKQLQFGTEYRLMNQDIANDQRSGFVTELMWEGLDPIILGIGYNFSDVSDNEYVDYDYSTQGPFLRLQGKF